MDVRFFRAINQITGRYHFLDNMMILISQKMRYVFFFHSDYKLDAERVWETIAYFNRYFSRINLPFRDDN